MEATHPMGKQRQENDASYGGVRRDSGAFATGSHMPAKKMTMGLIVGNRGFFPDHLARTGREEMISVLEADGLDVVVLTPEESKYGAVETREEAKRCAELFKRNQHRIDGIIVTLPNFGDELFAAIEGTAFHTRVILDRMASHGVPIKRVINAGGIPQKNDVLNQVYANVLGRPVLVPSKSVISLGSAIFAFLAAGIFKTVEDAQDRICPTHSVYEPNRSEQSYCDELYTLYSKLYFYFWSASVK
jgi:FGGY family of carbohydrate kinases, C-terminal domain